MKVLVVLTELSPYGGTLRFLERVLEIHDRRGIETVLLAPEGDAPGALAALAQRHGASVLRAHARSSADTPPLLTPYYDLLYCRHAIRSSRPDLVLVSTADPGRMSVAFYLSCPVLYVLHSVPQHRFRALPRLYLRLGSRLDNLVATVSEAAADEIALNMGLTRSGIAVLYNSCRVPAPTRERGEKPMVLTAGHLVDYKNPRLWLELARLVLERYPDACFAWLGDGELLDALRREVEEGPLKGRVLFPGYVEDPSPWFERACIYLQPSLRESHGIAVLEAMAHRLPCVVSCVGGLPESVADQETGFVCPPDDQLAFSRRILELLGDPALCRRMGDAGRRRVQAEFSPQRQEQRLISLYRKLTRNVTL